MILYFRNVAAEILIDLARLIVVPSCSKAPRRVSTRIRPITSPPGGGRSTVPQRARFSDNAVRSNTLECTAVTR